MAKKHGIPATTLKAEYKDKKKIKNGETASVKGEIVSIKSELKEFTNTSMRKMSMQLKLEDGSRVFVKRDEFINDEIRLFPKEFGGDFIEIDLMEVEDYRETHRIPTIELKGKNDTEVNKEHFLVSMELVTEKFEKGDIVRVVGTIEFDDYNPTTYIKPIKIFHSGEFKEEDPKALHATKRVVFEKIEKNEETGDIEVTMYHVTDREIYQRIAVVEDKALASNIKKRVQPYTAMDVSVEYKSFTQEEEINEEVEVDDEFDGWGVVEEFIVPDKQIVEYKHVLTLKGVNPKAFDTDTYSKEIIDSIFKKDDEATIQAEAEEGWGNGFDSTESESEFPF